MFKINIRKYSIHYFLVTIFLFYFYMAYNTPLTGDDWTWGTDRGIARLTSFFDGYNGRYFSNILELIVTRSEFIRYLIHALFSTLLIFALGKIIGGGKNIIPYLLSFILLLLLPPNIYAQTYGWTAGFVNYVPSIVLLLIFLLIAKKAIDDQALSSNKGLLFTIIPLGILTPLIVEHVSLFALFTAGCIVVYSFLKYKKVFLVHILYLLSLLIGSIIMFTNKAYLNVILGTDTYRTISNDPVEETGLLQRIYDTYTGDMYKYLFIENPLVNVFLGTMVVLLIINFVTTSKRNNYIIKPLLIFINIGFMLYVLFFKRILGFEYLGELTNDFEAIFSILYFLSIIITVILYVKDSTIKTRLLYYISGVVLLSAPFVFITPYGPRAALAPIVFLMLIGLEIYNYNIRNTDKTNEKLLPVFLSIALFVAITYASIFTIIGKAERDRIALIEQENQKNVEIINLPKLPFSQFMWMSSPPNEHFNLMFKLFYNIKEDTKVEFLPYDEFKMNN
ncbi:DUF6056 family protein [Virgibacillus sp. LDC-1]|uniref:DUF6056 family protein n=1 Tax=Virgibacillus sp. LDC-1 TaxID=3039856 RepID=UPI0024DEB862|nr:DUF6056 family protein [Virgibacillus sp. LDC-1]